MSTVMKFISPVDEFPLGSVFEDLPGVEVELERLIPHETLIIPYFWVRGVETEDIETSFEPHTGVTNIRLVDSVEDEYLMRAEWKPEYFGILSALAKANVVVLTHWGSGRKMGGDSRCAARIRRQSLNFESTAKKTTFRWRSPLSTQCFRFRERVTN